MKKIYPFHGGVMLDEHKLVSTQKNILSLPLPSRLVLPLRQSIGSAPKCLVSVGDFVKKGQRIAEADGILSVALHAPTSGMVIEIADYTVAHPSGLKAPCIIIEPDGHDTWISRTPVDFSTWSLQDIQHYLQEMGIVGLGGATFPSHIKLGTDSLETLIINGAECEPYISCDDMLMRERANDIVAGVKLLRKILAPQTILIGIEDNKPEAAAAFKKACTEQDCPAEVVIIPTLYPSGGAKQLTKLLTNKEIPSGVRSTELGVQCFNVATVYAIFRALFFAEPLISRIVTVTGNVMEPANYEVLFGTPLDELVWHAAPKDDTDGYIMGGPMMGFRTPTADVPVAKGSNCFIATSISLFPAKETTLPCIRCGDCVKVCPAQLQPQDLYWFTQAKNFEKAQAASLFDCIECGACAYVCPSKIPLVDYYRFAKSEIWAAQSQAKSANLAKKRYEFHQERLIREKAEKVARLAQKAAAKEALLANVIRTEDQARKLMIKAAMEKAAYKSDMMSAVKEVKEGDAALAALNAEKIREIGLNIKKSAAVLNDKKHLAIVKTDEEYQDDE